MAAQFSLWANDSLKKLVREYEIKMKTETLDELETKLYKEALEELQNRKLCKLTC